MTMTKFNPGDRVYYTGDASHEPWLARRTEKTPGTVTETHTYGTVEVEFEDTHGVGYVSGEHNLELITVSRVEYPDLIGPAPEPVTCPKYQGPFKAEGYTVRDKNGVRVAMADTPDAENESEVAQVIAAALNVYFEV